MVDAAPWRSHFWQRIRVLARFLSLHSLVQIVAVVTGLLVVRSMEKVHYAWYTIVFGLQGSISALSQFAMAGGIRGIGGERFGDPLAFGEVMSTARSHRLLIIGIGLPVLVPVYCFLLMKAECPPRITAALIGVILLNVTLLVEEQISAAPFGLARRYHIPQCYELGTFLLRLTLVVGLLVCGCFHPVPVIGASAVSLVMGVFLYLRPASDAYSAKEARHTPELRKWFLRYAFNGIPTMVNTMIQSQMGVLLIAYFGHMEAAADLGAITKMAVLFGIPTAVVDKIFISRLAVECDGRRLRAIWRQGVAVATGAASIIVGIVVLFGKKLIWILGEQYKGLADDLLLYSAYLGYLLVSGAAFGVLQAKGWLQHGWLIPVMMLSAQVLTLPFVNVATVQGIILLKFAGDLAGGLYATALLWRGFRGYGKL